MKKMMREWMSESIGFFSHSVVKKILDFKVSAVQLKKMMKFFYARK